MRLRLLGARRAAMRFRLRKSLPLSGGGAFFIAGVVRILLLATPLVVWPSIAPAQVQQQTFTPREEAPEDYPSGAGRDETFYACTACHGFKLVAQQGMNRRQWDDTLDWMTEKHGMPKLEGDDRKVVLDYLEATFPPTAAEHGGRSPNPFLPR
jgi:hypothetical protein